MNGTLSPEAFSIATLPAKTMISAIATPDSSEISPRTLNTFDNWSGLLTAQSFCGARRIRPPLAPPLISDPRYVEALAQAVSTISWILSPELAILALRASTS